MLFFVLFGVRTLGVLEIPIVRKTLPPYRGDGDLNETTKKPFDSRILAATDIDRKASGGLVLYIVELNIKKDGSQQTIPVALETAFTDVWLFCCNKKDTECAYQKQKVTSETYSKCSLGFANSEATSTCGLRTELTADTYDGFADSMDQTYPLRPKVCHFHY